MSSKTLVMDAILAALLLILQILMAPFPNMELVTLFVIIYTRLLKKNALAVILVFVLLEGLVYGFGIWWVSYLYVWPLLFGVTLVFNRIQQPLFWAVTASVFGLCFGLFCSIPYLFAGGPGAAFSWWVSGLPFDIIHSISNFILVLLLYSPLYRGFQWMAGQ